MICTLQRATKPLNLPADIPSLRPSVLCTEGTEQSISPSQGQTNRFRALILESQQLREMKPNQTADIPKQTVQVHLGKSPCQELKRLPVEFESTQLKHDAETQNNVRNHFSHIREKHRMDPSHLTTCRCSGAQGWNRIRDVYLMSHERLRDGFYKVNVRVQTASAAVSISRISMEISRRYCFIVDEIACRNSFSQKMFGQNCKMCRKFPVISS